MAAAGTNGTVTSCSSSTGNSATVDFPGPPPHTETYTDLSADKYATFLAAFTANAKVDTTANAEGNCSGVTTHR